MTINWKNILNTFLSAVLLILAANQISFAQYQQSNTNSQSYNQTNSGSNLFGNSGSYNNSGFNQQQNNGMNSGFGSSSSQNRLSGRNSSSRSSRRNSGMSPNNNRGTVNETVQPQTSRSRSSRNSGSSLNAVPPQVSGSNTSDIMIHSNSGDNQAQVKPNTRAEVPKPRIASKSFLYLKSSHLSTKVGEPFTLDVKLSGLPDAKMDQMSFVLSYNPDDMMPVQGKSSDGNWFPAQALDLTPNSDAMEFSGTTSQFLLNDSILKNTEQIENTVSHTEGKMIFHTKLTTPVKVESSTIARIVMVPLRQEKSARIEFLSQSDETGDVLSFVRLGEVDVLGSVKNPSDGMIPLDFVIQSNDSHSNNEIKDWTRDRSESGEMVSLNLEVNESVVQVGNVVELNVVLNNPAFIPVDEVEFLIVYNTRVLQPVDHEVINSIGLSRNGGLQINKEKGILQFKGAVRKTESDLQTTIASIQFKAVSPTTKTTFKVLVHKEGVTQDGTLPSTGAFYKGADILGDPSISTDGVHTTSVSVQPTMAYIQTKQKQF